MKAIALAAAVLSLAPISAASAAVTVGNPAVAAAVVDGCSVCTFVVNQAFGLVGAQVQSYQFYAGSTADITPLLLSRTDAGTTATFTVLAIGQLRNAATGVNSFAFNTAQGTNLTAANSYFGFAYGNGGVVQFDYSSPSPTSGTFVGSQNFAPTIGGSFTADFGTQPANSYNALNSRTYSINATAAVPEPATWAFMIVGFGMVGGAMRRRHAIRKAQAFA